MGIVAHSTLVTTSDSFATGQNVARELLVAIGEPPRLVLIYLTVNHDHAAFLRGMAEILGLDAPVVGCSVQGVIGKGQVREEGFAAAALALGGDSVSIATARTDDIQIDTESKGRELGRRLSRSVSGLPKATILLFDPLHGTDFDALLRGLHSELPCPILGGAAAANFRYNAGLQETHQYFGAEAFTHGAVAFTIGGELQIETALCHGCSPVGVEMVVTKAEGNVLVELDGRRASDLWKEICGKDFAVMTPALAIGVPVRGVVAGYDYFVRAALTADDETGRVTIGTPISEGVRIMLHHRTVPDVLDGARQMGESLAQRLAGRKVRAALAFECGARTRPFLGDEATLRENLMLQQCVGADAEWIGGMFWGELYPIANTPTFHNYSYPLFVIAE